MSKEAIIQKYVYNKNLKMSKEAVIRRTNYTMVKRKGQTDKGWYTKYYTGYRKTECSTYYSPEDNE